MSKCNRSKKHCHNEHDRTRHHTTDDTSRDEPKDDHPVWRWRYEDLLDCFLEFCHIERWYHMWERVHDHRHHHESWHDELHIRESSDDADTWSDELSEYHVVESCCDDGRDDRLLPHSEKPRDFFADDGGVWDEELWWVHSENSESTSIFRSVQFAKNS